MHLMIATLKQAVHRLVREGVGLLLGLYTVRSKIGCTEYVIISISVSRLQFHYTTNLTVPQAPLANLFLRLGKWFFATLYRETPQHKSETLFNNLQGRNLPSLRNLVNHKLSVYHVVDVSYHH